MGLGVVVLASLFRLAAGLGVAAAANIDLSLATPAASMAWIFGVRIASPASSSVFAGEGASVVDVGLGVLPSGDLVSSRSFSFAWGVCTHSSGSSESAMLLGSSDEFVGYFRSTGGTFAVSASETLSAAGTGCALVAGDSWPPLSATAASVQCFRGATRRHSSSTISPLGSWVRSLPTETGTATTHMTEHMR